jgi:hypothetical protein
MFALLINVQNDYWMQLFIIILNSFLDDQGYKLMCRMIFHYNTQFIFRSLRLLIDVQDNSILDCQD